MKLEEFETDTYVRRPFQVQAFEITQDNIAELAPHVGELCDDKGTPFIKSDKKKVGNNFKVWPGFFATVLKGHVRCYSRKTFFEQFGELNDKTAPVVEFLHGRLTYEELGLAVAPVIDSEPLVPEPVVERLDEEATIAETGSFAASEVTTEAPEEPVAAVEADEGPTCEHGTPLAQECIYKKCEGGDDIPEPSEEPSALEKYRSGLDSVIKS
jgi:hypothetical protein